MSAWIERGGTTPDGRRWHTTPDGVVYDDRPAPYLWAGSPRPRRSWRRLVLRLVVAPLAAGALVFGLVALAQVVAGVMW